MPRTIIPYSGPRIPAMPGAWPVHHPALVNPGAWVPGASKAAFFPLRESLELARARSQDAGGAWLIPGGWILLWPGEAHPWRWAFSRDVQGNLVQGPPGLMPGLDPPWPASQANEALIGPSMRRMMGIRSEIFARRGWAVSDVERGACEMMAPDPAVAPGAPGGPSEWVPWRFGDGSDGHSLGMSWPVGVPIPRTTLVEGRVQLSAMGWFRGVWHIVGCRYSRIAILVRPEISGVVRTLDLGPMKFKRDVEITSKVLYGAVQIVVGAVTAQGGMIAGGIKSLILDPVVADQEWQKIAGRAVEWRKALWDFGETYGRAQGEALARMG